MHGSRRVHGGRRTIPSRIALGGALSVALALGLVITPVAVDGAESNDPAGVNGIWSYRTRSNCGRVDGVGAVAFQWDPARNQYDDRGYVYWADSGRTIRWWGTARWDPGSRVLDASVSNSLGDHVSSRWQVIGQGPDRLVTRWNQTNGCHGEGVAIRPAPRGTP